LLILALLALLTFCPDALSEVEYTKLDRATVRVFALQGVKLDTVRHNPEDPVYQVAVPLAGHGTGVKISEDGLILTAQHIIDGARYVVVKIPGSDKSYPAEVVYENKKRDFAFLAIPGKHKYHLKLPKKAPTLQVRQVVNAVGYPLDADRESPQSTRGIVAGALPDGNLQLGIAVNSGNSGGPLVDLNDNLLGIVVARGDVSAGIQGLGVAVSLERIILAYDRYVMAGKHKRARDHLAAMKPAGWAVAGLVATLVERGNMMRQIVRTVHGVGNGHLEAHLHAAMLYSSGSPDVLALAAAYLWNESVIRHATMGMDPTRLRRKARHLCRQAEETDPTVLQRSPFVGVVLGRLTGYKTQER
jgi:hypothetical protein